MALTCDPPPSWRPRHNRCLGDEAKRIGSRSEPEWCELELLSPRPIGRGGRFALHPIDVFAEDAQAVSALTTAPAQFVSPTFTTAVTDGRLDLRFHNQHTGQNWEIAAIVIEKDNPTPEE